MRIVTNASKYRERQKDQFVMRLAQPLLTYFGGLARWGHGRKIKALGGETNK
jgi:hypothetical protein